MSTPRWNPDLTDADEPTVENGLGGENGELDGILVGGGWEHRGRR